MKKILTTRTVTNRENHDASLGAPRHKRLGRGSHASLAVNDEQYAAADATARA
jgi:hypothetical protein